MKSATSATAIAGEGDETTNCGHDPPTLRGAGVVLTYTPLPLSSTPSPPPPRNPTPDPPFRSSLSIPSAPPLPLPPPPSPPFSLLCDKPPVNGSPVCSRRSSWSRSTSSGRHRVAVLGLGIAALAHVGGERGHALDHLPRGCPRSASRSARRGRRRCRAGRGTPAPGRRWPAPAPMPITGISMRGMISVGERARHRLEDDREAAGLLERERVVHHLERRARPCGPASGSRRARWRSAA